MDRPIFSNDFITNSLHNPMTKEFANENYSEFGEQKQSSIFLNESSAFASSVIIIKT